MYRVRTTFTSPVGGPYLSTHYVLESDPLNPVDTEAQAAATAVGNFWVALDDLMTNDVSWAVEASVDVVAPATGTLTDSFGVTPASGVGADAGDMIPAAAQGLIRWVTSTIRNGRRVRGRTFVPGIAEARLLDGQVTAGAVGIMLAAGQALDAAVDLVVWSRPSAVPGGDGVAAQVTSVAVWNQFAVLTSRRD